MDIRGLSPPSWFIYFDFFNLFFFEAQGTAIHLWDFFSPFFFLNSSCFYLRLPGTVELFTRQALSFFCQLRTNPFGQLCLVTSDHLALFSSSLRFSSFLIIFLIIFFKLLLLPSVHLDSRIWDFFLSMWAVYITWEFCSQELYLDTTGSLTRSKILTMQQYKPGSLKPGSLKPGSLKPGSLQHAMSIGSLKLKGPGRIFLGQM